MEDFNYKLSIDSCWLQIEVLKASSQKDQKENWSVFMWSALLRPVGIQEATRYCAISALRAKVAAVQFEVKCWIGVGLVFWSLKQRTLGFEKLRQLDTRLRRTIAAYQTRGIWLVESSLSSGRKILSISTSIVRLSYPSSCIYPNTPKIACL